MPADTIDSGLAVDISLTVNGVAVADRVEPRLLLADFLRHRLRLTGTHVGCAHGVCGACTVIVDGRTARSCLMFAVQAAGRTVRTVESLADGAALSPLQEAFHRGHALQCGYCTPGILMTLTCLMEEGRAVDEAELRTVLSGHLCRCTGYVNIVRAAAACLQQRGDPGAGPA